MSGEREAFVNAARSMVGLSAAPATHAAYVDALATALDGPAERDAIAVQSGCELTVFGALRGAGCTAAVLDLPNVPGVIGERLHAGR